MEHRCPIRDISSPFKFFLSYRVTIQIICVLEEKMTGYSQTLIKISNFLRSIAGPQTDTAKSVCLYGFSVSFVSVFVFEVFHIVRYTPILLAIQKSGANSL